MRSDLAAGQPDPSLLVSQFQNSLPYTGARSGAAIPRASSAPYANDAISLPSPLRLAALNYLPLMSALPHRHAVQHASYPVNSHATHGGTRLGSKAGRGECTDDGVV